MSFEAEIIKALQTLSNGFTDIIGIGVSYLGTELLFMAIAVVIYWCIDKAFAYRFFNTYVLGVAVANVMKIGFKRVRPFNAYAGEIKSIGAPEQSYSFPSGHTESISSISTVLTMKYGRKREWIPIVFWIATVLVMISRMFLGQHYLSDVFCGLTVGVACAMIFSALLSLLKDKEEWFGLGAVALSCVVIGVTAGLGKLNESPDLLKGLGAFIAFDIGYLVEKKLVKYNVNAGRKKWKYFLRVLIGLGVALGIQQGFKFFLPEDVPMLHDFLRYFIVAFWASLIAPALFKLAKI